METNKKATITDLSADLAYQLYDAGFCIYWTDNNTFEISKKEEQKQEEDKTYGKPTNLYMFPRR